MAQIPDHIFMEMLPRAAIWAQRQEQFMLGNPASLFLVPQGQDMARRAGVAEPEAVRILGVPEIPPGERWHPKSPTISRQSACRRAPRQMGTPRSAPRPIPWERCHFHPVPKENLAEPDPLCPFRCHSSRPRQAHRPQCRRTERSDRRYR